MNILFICFRSQYIIHVLTSTFREDEINRCVVLNFKHSFVIFTARYGGSAEFMEYPGYDVKHLL